MARLVGKKRCVARNAEGCGVTCWIVWCNCSSRSGRKACVSAKWKDALIVPILKKGDHSLSHQDTFARLGKHPHMSGDTMSTIFGEQSYVVIP